MINNKKVRVKSTVKVTGADRAFEIVNSTLLVIIFCLTIYPLIYVFSASFSAPQAVASGEMWLYPVGFSLDGYQYILEFQDIWMGYRNTIFYTVVGTSLNLLFTIPCAYALSRKELIGRNFIMGMFIVTMYISGGLIPSYLNMDSFELVNTPFALLIGGLVSTFNLIIARTFMVNSIPGEIVEAAKIDGCNDFSVFLRMILPLSSPIIVVMGLYYGISHWNSYFQALIYITDRELYPLQMFLREILIQGEIANSMLEDSSLTAEEILQLMKDTETTEMIKYCVIIAASLPMMIIYPRLQKYFAKGVMLGSVKG